VPELAALADGLAEALALLATRLREGGAQQELPPLRGLYRSLVQEAGGRLAGPLAAELDELIDATNTVAASVGMKLP
jgi:hypothetical protein